MEDRRDDDTMQVDVAEIREVLRAARENATKELEAPVEGGEQRFVILIIRGIVERLVVHDRFSMVLGRRVTGDMQQPDFDLGPFDGLARGVSRIHARLHMVRGVLHVSDLGSTNGTFLADERLPANVPIPLEKGTQLMLGSLPIRVLYR